MFRFTPIPISLYTWPLIDYKLKSNDKNVNFSPILTNQRTITQICPQTRGGNEFRPKSIKSRANCFRKRLSGMTQFILFTKDSEISVYSPFNVNIYLNRMSTSCDAFHRDALMKMKQTYEQNNALGDPLSVEGQLTENGQKMDKLQTEMKKFQSLLSEVVDGNRTPSAQKKSHRNSISEDSLSRSASESSVTNNNNTNNNLNINSNNSNHRSSNSLQTVTNHNHNSHNNHNDSTQDNEWVPLLSALCCLLYNLMIYIILVLIVLRVVSAQVIWVYPTLNSLTPSTESLRTSCRRWEQQKLSTLLKVWIYLFICFVIKGFILIVLYVI